MKPVQSAKCKVQNERRRAAIGRTFFTLNFAFCLALAAAGCSSNTASVSGTVTYDGQPVGTGEVTFTPVDGIGPTSGGRIKDGQYTVDGLTPGRKTVKVMAVKAVPFARSTEEMARRAAENKSKGDGSGLIDPADTIPPDAEGNNATHEIKAGKQTLNLDLKKPAKAKA
jgi:hypothetical protein